MKDIFLYILLVLRIMKIVNFWNWIKTKKGVGKEVKGDELGERMAEFSAGISPEIVKVLRDDEFSKSFVKWFTRTWKWA